MVSDKFRPVDTRQPEVPPKVEQIEKGQDVLKAEKKELKFSSHTIKSGETLSEICQQYGIPLKALYAVNQHELDPKIMLKDGKIAYGAPTYHVGDKLNIPSAPDVPNAVKYFDAWAKATIAQQRLEKPTEQKAGMPAEKTPSRTQILDDEHLAAKNAALMAKVAMETRYNQFRTQHEGQGAIDDAWDWMKKTAGVGDSSADIEKEFANQRGLVDQMMKAAKNENLRQFRNLYKQCTGKQYNQGDFLQASKKPTSLAFEDLSEKYRKSQEAGNRGIQLTAAGLVAATAFIPGAAPVSLPLAGRLTLGAGVGAIASGAADYANKGSTDNLKNSMSDGAIVGVSVAASVPLAAATETTILAGGTATATRQVLAGLAGGSAGGATAGGMIEGGLTTKDDASKGKFDLGHIAQKTGEGIVTGAVIGAPIGATGPVLKNVLNIQRPVAAAAAEADTAATTAGAADAATSENVAAQAFNKTSQLPPKEMTTTPKEVPQQSPQPDVTDTAKTGQPTDSTKGTTSTQTDISKTSQTTDAAKGTAQQTPDASKTQDLTKATGQDVSKGQAGDKWDKGSTHDVPAKDSPTPDVVQEQPTSLQSQFYRNYEAWQKRLANIEHDPLVKNVEPLDLQNGWQGVKYERTTGGRIVEEMYSTKDSSRISTEVYKDGRNIAYREVTTNSNGREITNKFRMATNAAGEEVWTPTNNAWEKRLFELRADKKVSNIEEFPMNDDWTGVRYQRNGGTSTVEERVRISDGTKVINEEGVVPGTGNRWKETTMISNGKMTVHQFKRGLNSKGEEDWVRVNPRKAGDAPSANTQDRQATPEGERTAESPKHDHKWTKEKIELGKRWVEDKLQTLGPGAKEVYLPQGRKAVKYADETGASITESYNPVSGWKAVKYTDQSGASITESYNPVSGWKAVKYTDQSGASITEAYNPANGNRHTIREYQEGSKYYRENSLDVPKDGIKLWRKEEGKAKLTTGLEEDNTLQIDYRTIETKRTTLTESGKTRTDVSTINEDGQTILTTSEQ